MLSETHMIGDEVFAAGVESPAEVKSRRRSWRQQSFQCLRRDRISHERTRSSPERGNRELWEIDSPKRTRAGQRRRRMGAPRCSHYRPPDLAILGLSRAFEPLTSSGRWAPCSSSKRQPQIKATATFLSSNLVPTNGKARGCLGMCTETHPICFHQH